MSSCERCKVYRSWETRSWEQEGGWPDTSVPPDSETSKGPKLWEDFDGCNDMAAGWGLCFKGQVPVVLGKHPAESQSCHVSFQKWYEVDPEIPHLKTYHIVEKKVIDVYKCEIEVYACLDPSRLKEFERVLKDHLPA